MSVGRVTQQMLVQRVLANLTRQTRRIADLQEQLATGQRVNKLADDPLAARRAVRARAESAAVSQYLDSINNARPWLADTETTVRTAVDVINRAHELGLQGANQTNAQEQRDALAEEVNQLLEQLLALGNRQTNGRYLFGGTRTDVAPYDATRNGVGEITAVTYLGNEERITVPISEGVSVPTNEPGAGVFSPGTNGSADLFTTLISLRDDLRAGNFTGIQSGLSALDDGRTQLLNTLARLGAVQNRLDLTDQNLQDIRLTLQQVISDNLDADFAETVLQLNAQTNAYQAALNASARVIQPSLLDFIR